MSETRKLPEILYEQRLRICEVIVERYFPTKTDQDSSYAVKALFSLYNGILAAVLFCFCNVTVVALVWSLIALITKVAL